MSLDDDLRHAFLTSGLTDEQRAELAAAGEERPFAAGDDLFQEGKPADFLWVLLEGEIDLTRHLQNQTTKVASMTAPGQWAGGLAAWGPSDGSAVYRASGHAVTDGRCLVVPAAELGRLVEAWSPFAKHMILGVYQTVRNIDAAARQRDSLVALGTLAAGLAHEINNPAAASMRSVESLRNTTQYLLESLVALAQQGIVAEQFLALDALRVDLQSREVADDGAIARADREELVGGWMERHGIALAWQLAPVLATYGVDRPWLEALETSVGPDAVEPALRWVTSAIGTGLLLNELGDATSRITHLVEDVKNYSQLDRADTQRVDLRSGIESTLVILRPKLQHVEVVRAFEDGVPDIEVHPAELNQVWTNLIDNAVDAMDGNGTLTIGLRRDGDDVLVEVTDTGPGIPLDLQSRVFEPFFTTKDVGKGTGLGLDISRRIVVERHGGDITFECVPGATTVRVRLPLR